jgi:formylglycine-generating enzyme required for sulfatase activity
MRMQCGWPEVLLALLWVSSCASAGPEGEHPIRLTNSVGMELILVKPGKLTVPDRRTGKTRTLVVEGPLYLGKLEVTQQQWQRVMGRNPSRFLGDRHPVEMVTWLDCVEFCRKLSELEGRKYRLPTAAEWEYTCRAGSKGKFCFGDDEGKLGEYAWYGANSGEKFDERGRAVNGKTRPAGQKLPNGWGFLDMHGNVAEFCADDRKPRKATLARQKTRGVTKIIPSHPYKGGTFYQSSFCCQASFEDLYPPDWKSFIIGLRVALDASPPAP